MILLLVIMTMMIASLIVDDVFAFHKASLIFNKQLSSFTRTKLLTTNKGTIEFQSIDDESIGYQTLDTQTTTTKSSDEWKDYKSRFDNVARLYDGDISLNRLFRSHVCVSFSLFFFSFFRDACIMFIHLA